jgi:3-dehydroquinate dehydratase-2
MTMKILVLNGPNINMLGIREPGIYGKNTFADLLQLLQDTAKELNIEVEQYQSNHEGAIIDKLQEAYFNGTEGIVINPGAYTHYSYAIRDALASLTGIPKIEVHISDVNSREEFRHISVTEPVCDGQIVGQGLKGYIMAIDILNKK